MDGDIYFILICNRLSKKYYLLRTSYLNEFKQIQQYKVNKSFVLFIFGSSYTERVCRLTVIASLRARGYKYGRYLLNDFLIHKNKNYLHY